MFSLRNGFVSVYLKYLSHVYLIHSQLHKLQIRELTLLQFCSLIMTNVASFLRVFSFPCLIISTSFSAAGKWNLIEFNTVNHRHKPISQPELLGVVTKQTTGVYTCLLTQQTETEIAWVFYQLQTQNVKAPALACYLWHQWGPVTATEDGHCWDSVLIWEIFCFVLPSPKAAQRFLCTKEQVMRQKAGVWIFFHCWKLKLPFQVHSPFRWNSRFSREERWRTCSQDFPTVPVACNILVVATKKMKLMQHRNLLDFFFFILGWDYLSNYLERNQLILEN